MPDTSSPEILAKPLPPELRLPTVSLTAHAVEHRRPNGIMTDWIASVWHEALCAVYHDMPNLSGELIDGIIARSILIDYAVLSFCGTYDRAIVSDLGCGFSTRSQRLCPQVEAWVHVDLPEVIRARSALGQIGANELALGRDLCDLDLKRPLTPSRAPNSLFILEGVLNHLPRDRAWALVQFLCKHHKGSTVIGTVMTPPGQDGLTTLTNDLRTPFPHWSIDSTSELGTWLLPARMERVWLLGKVATRLGLVRPVVSKEASGLAFLARL